jgi:hypothetical protein
MPTRKMPDAIRSGHCGPTWNATTPIGVTAVAAIVP